MNQKPVSLVEIAVLVLGILGFFALAGTLEVRLGESPAYASD